MPGKATPSNLQKVPFLLPALPSQPWCLNSEEAGGGDGANTTQSQMGPAESSGAVAPHEYRAGAFLTASEPAASFPSLFSA